MEMENLKVVMELALGGRAAWSAVSGRGNEKVQ
jgi:hypothetical protein